MQAECRSNSRLEVPAWNNLRSTSVLPSVSDVGIDSAILLSGLLWPGALSKHLVFVPAQQGLASPGQEISPNISSGNLKFSSSLVQALCCTII